MCGSKVGKQISHPKPGVVDATVKRNETSDIVAVTLPGRGWS